MKLRRTFPAATALLLIAVTLSAQESKQEGDKQDKAKADAGEERTSVTKHTVVIGGREVKYTATAGKMAMKTDEGQEKAHIFYVAYTKDGESEPRTRPLTFCFNGGPGSSSVWLHLGMLGPKRVKLPAEAVAAAPPYELVPNEFSLLDITDLVFIDPVSTGFSRPAKGEQKNQFHGYDEDLKSVAQFIYDFTSSSGRWLSPKYLIGESYGGLRAAGLAGELRSRYNLELSGLVLVSAVVDFQTISFGGSNDLPYILFLPSYAATAWYHKALPGDLQKLPLKQVVAEAEEFALGDYASALLRGSALPEGERGAVAERLARYTGLTKEYVEGADLRISMGRFAKELLREKGLTVGRFDSRYTGRDRDTVGEDYEYDASAAAVFGAFTATLNDYVRRELDFEEERVYEILTGNVHPWSYDRFENRYVDASDSLRRAMTANPHLKLFVACGYFDLATPHFAMDHTINHLGLPEEARRDITRRYYKGGHMMYVVESSLQALREDLVKFYAE